VGKATRERRRALAREQRMIKARLSAAAAPNAAGPVLGRARIGYELAGRSRGVAHGGMNMIAALVAEVGLAAEIDDSVRLLAQHRPYHESDHVFNIACNALCGGTRLEDIETRRNDAVLLDGLGAAALLDPTTAGDFCRRFDEAAILAVQEAVNRSRLQGVGPSASRLLGPDGTRRRRCHHRGHRRRDQAGHGHRLQRHLGLLMVSLANTAEPLYVGLRGANRPSHEGVVPSMTGPSPCAARPGLPTSCCEATPTSRSPPSSTAGTATACASCSATTPRPTSSREPARRERTSTTTW